MFNNNFDKISEDIIDFLLISEKSYQHNFQVTKASVYQILW